MKPGRKRQIRILDNGCHLHGGRQRTRGYAQYKHEGRRCSAARVVWLEERGPIPEGLQVDHLCRNRECVNVEHLELVTPAENIRRSNVAKLTLEQAREIRASLNSSGRVLALRFGVSEATVSMIRSGKTWREEAA